MPELLTYRFKLWSTMCSVPAHHIHIRRLVFEMCRRFPIYWDYWFEELSNLRQRNLMDGLCRRKPMPGLQHAVAIKQTRLSPLPRTWTIARKGKRRVRLWGLSPAGVASFEQQKTFEATGWQHTVLLHLVQSCHWASQGKSEILILFRMWSHRINQAAILLTLHLEDVCVWDRGQETLC